MNWPRVKILIRRSPIHRQLHSSAEWTLDYLYRVSAADYRECGQGGQMLLRNTYFAAEPPGSLLSLGNVGRFDRKMPYTFRASKESGASAAGCVIAASYHSGPRHRPLHSADQTPASIHRVLPVFHLGR